MAGRYVEMLDAGVRIAARFHSHCPQTARLYYHPPAPNSEDLHHHHHTQNGGSGYHAPVEEPTRMPSWAAQAARVLDTADFIFYSVV